MQASPKKEEVVRINRPSGPLHFAEPSEQTVQRLQQEVAYASYPNGPFTVVPPAYGLPTPPGYGTLPHFAPGASAAWSAWPQTPLLMQQPLAHPLATQAALLQRYAATTQGTPFAPTSQRLPPADLVDEGAEYVCQIELPGVKKENIDISCFENGLLVTASAEPDIDLGALVQSERGATINFRRVINLPSQVQPSRVSAKLHDGLLTINLPKSSPTEGPRRVNVT